MSNEIIERPEDSLATYKPELRVARVDPATANFNAHAVIGHLARYANLASIAGAIKKGTQYVVQVPTHLQVALDSGKYTMLHGKESGKMWATIVEKLPSGKNKFIDNCPIVEEAFYHGNPLQDASSNLVNLQMQQQMAALAQLVGETYEAILRVESGQKADRIGQLIAGRDGIVHALKMKDPESREQQIVAARQSLLEAQGKIGEVLREKASSFKGLPRRIVAQFVMEIVQSGYLDKRDGEYDAIHEYYDLYMQATQLIAKSFLICNETESAVSVFDSCKQFIGSLDFSKLGTVLYTHRQMLKSELFYHQAAEAIAKEKTFCLEAAKPYDVIEITLDGAEIMEVLENDSQEKAR